MRRLLSLACIVFVTLSVSAQPDQKARTILENVTKTTQSYSTIQASFDYVMDNKDMDIHEENKGDIIMKGDKYKLKLPVLGLEVYCNGTEVWTYMKDANEVTVSPMDSDSGEMMNPSKLFTIYENGFSYKFIEEKAIDGKACYVIDLFPETDGIEYSRIRIQIDKERMLIKNAEMFGQEGNSYIVKVNDLKTNIAATDALFNFDKGKYPGVDVIDLR